MAFTELGKKIQRQSITKAIASVHIILKAGAPIEFLADRIVYEEGQDTNPINGKLVATGAEIGIGNTVTGLELVAADGVILTDVFAQESTCVTDIDTFTFNISVGN